MSKYYSEMIGLELLKKYGKCTSKNDEDEDSFYSRVYNCSFSYFGLNISSSIGGYYGYDDEKVKSQISDVDISLNGKMVLCSALNIYIPGKWEDLLEEMYLNEDKLERVIAESEIGIERLLNNVIEPYASSIDKGEKVNKWLKGTGIKIYATASSEGEVDTYDLEYFKILKVWYYGKLVFDIKVYEMPYGYENGKPQYKYILKIYEHGDWEEKLLDIVRDAKLSELTQSNISTEHYIDQYLKLLREK